MKVLFYVGYPLAWAKGGHAIQILESQRALERLGCEVQWLHHEDPDIPKADILHYWSRPPNDLHWKLAQRQGLKLVISEYHQTAVLRPRWTWPLRRHLSRMLRLALGPNLFAFFGSGIYGVCDAAIAVTESEAAYMRIVFGAPASKVHCVPNGVDDAFFDATVKPEPRDSLLYIGYICDRKNSVPVARSALAAKVPVTFIGCAPSGDKDSYVNEFKTLVDNRNVFWMGEITDRRRLAAIIRGARGVVLASRNEGLGMSILEALACHKPVLCSNLPNLRAYYRDAVMYCHQPSSRRFIVDLQRFDHYCGTAMTKHVAVPKWTDVGRSLLNVYNALLARTPLCGTHPTPKES